MKSSKFIILHWLYTIVLINVFYWTIVPKTHVYQSMYVSAMFMMLAILPIFVKFVLDDIEDEYLQMWRQLRNYGRIR